MKPVIWSIYQHYKTKWWYQVIALAIDESDLSEKVVYEYVSVGHGSDWKDHFPLGTIWVRWLDNFMSELELEWVFIPRFRLVDEL